ncbi:hypothetical protein HDV01_001910 [Terramyces sp. JEL0728]|nr:hypothetical protein HDV01_001910 [Terramyces sp. JEL0728]
MSFFTQTQEITLSLVDINNHPVIPNITVVPKKGIWCEDNTWNCYKRNQFQLTVNIDSVPHLFYHNTPIVKFKIDISCSDVLDSKKLFVQQKTKRRVERVQPVFLHLDSTSKITIPKLQFNKSTPSNKNRNLSDSYFQLVVNISVVAGDDTVFPLTAFSSENLNVLSCTPSQYRVEKYHSTRYYSSNTSNLAGCKFNEFARNHSPPNSDAYSPALDFFESIHNAASPISGEGSQSPNYSLTLDGSSDNSLLNCNSIFTNEGTAVAHIDPIDSMVYNFLLEPFCK